MGSPRWLIKVDDGDEAGRGELTSSDEGPPKMNAGCDAAVDRIAIAREVRRLKVRAEKVGSD